MSLINDDERRELDETFDQRQQDYQQELARELARLDCILTSDKESRMKPFVKITGRVFLFLIRWLPVRWQYVIAGRMDACAERVFNDWD